MALCSSRTVLGLGTVANRCYVGGAGALSLGFEQG